MVSAEGPQGAAPRLLPQHAAGGRTLCRCRRCPRLVSWRQAIDQRGVLARNRGKPFWARPVPGYGDPEAWLLVIGLAPGFNGANRTGIPFVGDFSGRVLFGALHRMGWCDPADPREPDQAPVLRGVFITNVLKCVPPQNKPLAAEIANCRPHFQRDLARLPRLRWVLALGRVAHDAYLDYASERAGPLRRADFRFAYGAVHDFGRLVPRLIDSYHTSQQNVFTGRMDEAKLVALLEWAAPRLVQGHGQSGAQARHRDHDGPAAVNSVQDQASASGRIHRNRPGQARPGG